MSLVICSNILVYIVILYIVFKYLYVLLIDIDDYEFIITNYINSFLYGCVVIELYKLLFCESSLEYIFIAIAISFNIVTIIAYNAIFTDIIDTDNRQIKIVNRMILVTMIFLAILF